MYLHIHSSNGYVSSVLRILLVHNFVLLSVDVGYFCLMSPHLNFISLLVVFWHFWLITCYAQAEKGKPKYHTENETTYQVLRAWISAWIHRFYTEGGLLCPVAFGFSWTWRVVELNHVWGKLSYLFPPKESWPSISHRIMKGDQSSMPQQKLVFQMDTSFFDSSMCEGDWCGW